jgi:hypothetical protein
MHASAWKYSEPVLRHRPQELDPGIGGRLGTQPLLFVTRPRDEQVDAAGPRPELDERMQPLDRLQSPHEEEVGVLMRPRAGGLPVLIDSVDEVRQVRERLGETSLGVHPSGEAAGRDELVDVPARPFEQAGVAPELRRALGHDRAGQALRPLAGAAVELPEHVDRADQPVLVGSVELHGAASAGLQGQDVRAEQRDVVVVHHVVSLAVDHLSDGRLFQVGSAGLLRG